MIKPYYLLLFAPVPILAQQVTYLWQVPWWAGLRFALISTCFMLGVYAFLEHALQRIHVRHPNAARSLTIIAASMLGFMLLAIGISALVRDTKPHEHPRGIAAGPDVYFIVLDSYTASETLLKRFGYDNSWFLEDLRLLGFQAGDCVSPYAYTGPSLASILNGGGAAPTETWLNWRLVQRSQLRQTLTDRGYDTIAFTTGFDWLDIRDAAYYFEPALSLGPTDFELFLLGSPSWNDWLGDHFRQRTLTVLDHLDTAADLPGSQFTYAHVVQPHPPFVFNWDGSPLADASLINPTWNGNGRTTVQYSPENYASGYIGQVKYISQAILEPLRRILAKDPHPLIILIGDHGPWYAPEYELNTLCAVFGDLPLEPVEAVNKITHLE